MKKNIILICINIGLFSCSNLSKKNKMNNDNNSEINSYEKNQIDISKKQKISNLYLNELLINLIKQSEQYDIDEIEYMESLKMLFKKGANPNLEYNNSPIFKTVLKIFKDRYFFFKLFFDYRLEIESFKSCFDKKNNNNQLSKDVIYEFLYKGIKYSNFNLCIFLLNNFELKDISSYKTSLFYRALKEDNIKVLKYCLRNKWYIPNNYKYYNPSYEDKEENFISSIVDNSCYYGCDKVFEYILYKTCIPIFVCDQEDDESQLILSLFSKIYRNEEQRNINSIIKGRKKIEKIFTEYIINCKPGILKKNVIDGFILRSNILTISNDIIDLISYFCIGNDDKETDCGNASLSLFIINKLIENLKLSNLENVLLIENLNNIKIRYYKSF